MVKPSRLSSPSEPSLYSSWADHHQHPADEHQPMDEHHHHQQVSAIKNGSGSTSSSNMLNLWNNDDNSTAASAASANVNDNDLSRALSPSAIGSIKGIIRHRRQLIIQQFQNWKKYRMKKERKASPRVIGHCRLDSIVVEFWTCFSIFFKFIRPSTPNCWRVRIERKEKVLAIFLSL